MHLKPGLDMPAQFDGAPKQLIMLSLKLAARTPYGDEPGEPYFRTLQDIQVVVQAFHRRRRAGGVDRLHGGQAVVPDEIQVDRGALGGSAVFSVMQRGAEVSRLIHAPDAAELIPLA